MTTSTACGAAPPPPANQPPVAVNDVDPNTYFQYDTATIAVLANDSDPDGDPLTVTGVTCTSGCIVGVSSGKFVDIIGTTNASGTATAIYAYGPYGESANLAGSRFAYTGQIAIPEAGIYYYKARFYSPSLGRFLSTELRAQRAYAAPLAPRSRFAPSAMLAA
ncbi:MAG: RHS repeat-associated core domain-containing protein [Pseudomonadota bacterium]